MTGFPSFRTALPLLTAAGLWGQAPPKADPLEQALVDLLNTPVTVASKKVERTADAAATVSSYPGRFLDDMGINTLGDLAEVTPGYGSYRIYGERVFTTRGQKAGSFNNNRHLLLVDGIPIQHARNDKVPTEEEFPLFFADRVEFLRGPASSLYGRGAFFGVVSLTPQQSPGGTRVQTTLGSGNDARSRQASALITHGSERAESLVAFSCFSKGDSLQPVGLVDEAGNLYRDGRTSMFMMVRHQIKEGAFSGLTAGSLMLYKTGNLGENWNWGTYTTPLDSLTWATFIPYLKYEHALAPGLRFQGYLTCNESQEKGSSTPFKTAPTTAGTGSLLSVYDIRVASWEALAEVTWEASTNLDVVAGLKQNVRWQRGAADGGYLINLSADPGDPYPGVPVQKTGNYRTTSAYVQAHQRLPVLSGLIIVGGARLDRGDAPGNTFSRLSPRMGVVQKVTDRFNLKLLYGTAFRGPGIKEVELNREKQSLNPGLALPELKAETFQTLELAATYTTGMFSGSLTGFTNRTADTLDPSADLKGAFINSLGILKARGAELELRMAARDGFRGWINASLARATSPDGSPVPDVQDVTASAGASYTFLPQAPLPIQAGAIVRYMGPFRVADPALARPKGGTFLDLHVATAGGNGLNFSLDIRNVTQVRMKYPKAGRPDVPAPGRQVMLNLRLDF